jgi:GNAT superfamily N-acetyltransferase
VSPLSGRRPIPFPALARLEVAEATLADAAALQRCLEGAPDYHQRTDGAPAAPGAAAHLLHEAEADPLRRVFLLTLRSGALPAGLLDLWLDQPEPGTAHLGLLLLREPLHGRGLGRELVAGLETALAGAGVSLLRLSVGDENAEAHAFWGALDFAAVGRLGGGVTVYEKALRPL